MKIFPTDEPQELEEGDVRGFCSSQRPSRAQVRINSDVMGIKKQSV